MSLHPLHPFSYVHPSMPPLKTNWCPSMNLCTCPFTPPLCPSASTSLCAPLHAPNFAPAHTLCTLHAFYTPLYSCHYPSVHYCTCSVHLQCSSLHALHCPMPLCAPCHTPICVPFHVFPCTPHRAVHSLCPSAPFHAPLHTPSN